jgi:hypothetical protein
VIGSAVPAIVVAAVSHALNARTAGAKGVIRLVRCAQGAYRGRISVRMGDAWDAAMLIILSSA